MRCPYCGHSDTAVKDSRATDDESTIRRRRNCQTCGSRFTTFERVQLRELTVIKRNKELEPFDRDKLARSIYTALRKRPIEAERVEQMINGLVRRLETVGDNELSSAQIGKMVLESLINLDEVAYLRFASVYKDFNTVQDFMDLITHMSDRLKENDTSFSPDK